MAKKILVIDDEKNIRVMLSECLIEAGYGVIEAADGKQGIAIAQREAPDLILLDIVMPEIDGAKAADILKNNIQTKNIPIIFLTNLLSEDDVHDGYVDGSKIGNQHFIAKPFKRDELLSLIEECMTAGA